MSMNKMLSYTYIQDKYKDFIENIGNDLCTGIVRDSKQVSKQCTPIWICWLQGLENAPNIVKCCVNSIVANVEGEIHIITYNNYMEYVRIDEVILEKHKLGIISRTHFSDIIRLALLCKYGGIWMDATLFMMDRGLPGYIYEISFFMYRLRETVDSGYPDPRLFSNWFIKSEKGNPILRAVYRMHEEWWKSENEIPYSMFHYVMRLVWDRYNNLCLGDTESLRLNIYGNNCQILIGMLNEEYDEMVWNMLRDESPLQKLSWKFDYKGESTFYGYIKEKYEKGFFAV